MVVIPYVENISKAVARIIRKHNVPEAMKPYKTLKECYKLTGITEIKWHQTLYQWHYQKAVLQVATPTTDLHTARSLTVVVSANAPVASICTHTQQFTICDLWRHCNLIVSVFLWQLHFSTVSLICLYTRRYKRHVSRRDRDTSADNADMSADETETCQPTMQTYRPMRQTCPPTRQRHVRRRDGDMSTDNADMSADETDMSADETETCQPTMQTCPPTRQKHVNDNADMSADETETCPPTRQRHVNWQCRHVRRRDGDMSTDNADMSANETDMSADETETCQPTMQTCRLARQTRWHLQCVSWRWDYVSTPVETEVFPSQSLAGASPSHTEPVDISSLCSVQVTLIKLWALLIASSPSTVKTQLRYSSPSCRQINNLTAIRENKMTAGDVWVWVWLTVFISFASVSSAALTLASHNRQSTIFSQFIHNFLAKFSSTATTTAADSTIQNVLWCQTTFGSGQPSQMCWKIVPKCVKQMKIC